MPLCSSYERPATKRHGALDVLFRGHRGTASAEAFFRRALAIGVDSPTIGVGDHHRPYIQAVRTVFPEATHVRTGLHRVQGETTKSVERSHIATRDRLLSSRGLKTLATGQRFFEGFEAVRALGHGSIHLERLVPGCQSLRATHQDRTREVSTAIATLGSRLRRAAC